MTEAEMLAWVAGLTHEEMARLHIIMSKRFTATREDVIGLHLSQPFLGRERLSRATGASTRRITLMLKTCECDPCRAWRATMASLDERVPQPQPQARKPAYSTWAELRAFKAALKDEGLT